MSTSGALSTLLCLSVAVANGLLQGAGSPAPGPRQGPVPAPGPIASPAASPAASPGEEGIDYYHELFEDEWHNEYGKKVKVEGKTYTDYPSYEDTHKKSYYDPKKYEDPQSDGKPSVGLRGKDVGAHLPYPLPQN
mmetsp:Transcript_107660/g.213946  ORF Transcript_107660/g.213946 Transcript_107660/m.213946 type:complete len:135 (-) Transcript_107660:96-500(-)|eukprot:CAMPEP_0172718130 /NCGR_PEP_ID=MMETSP1074-20121228/73474_1 /TAXON_ID=2916 /ORGANISM="Ceratium fusus, Strain PA161109" /LENGTH=134 /DNA_ID=CAMNT_0013543225 /DNA_START=57 /DNA_END=461 /DNA_ORIENTATION=+